MEILQLPLALIFTIIILFFMIVKDRKKSKHKLPPGPQTLPFIGNLHHLTGALPHRSLRDLSKKYGPVMHLQLGEVPTLIISSAEAAKEVMRNQDLTFADRPQIIATKLRSDKFSNLSFALYGKYWREIRKICTLQILSVKRVQSYGSIREEEVASLVKSVSSSVGAPVNLSKLLLAYAYSVTCRAAFGKSSDDEDEFLSAAKEIIQSAGGFDVHDIFPSYKILHRISGKRTAIEKVYCRIDNILTKIIDDKKTKRGYKLNNSEVSSEKDLLDVLLNIQESNDLDFPLTTINIKGAILDIFFGGTETSSTIVQWAISELIKNPQSMEKAQVDVRRILNGKTKIDESDIQEMNYLKLVIKETLRLHPPLPLLLPREARQECKINGYDIPIKTKVIINGWAIGRDPEYWTNPECFDPDRFIDSSIDFQGNSFEYIPFGAGRRMCPGISFGTANIELPLAQLLYNFDWKLPNGTQPEEFDMSEAFGATVTRKNDLMLIANPYTP